MKREQFDSVGIGNGVKIRLFLHSDVYPVVSLKGLIKSKPFTDFIFGQHE